MKLITLFFVFWFASTIALPRPDKEAEITEFENDASEKERYRFAYKSSDGIEREEEAEIKKLNDDTVDDTSISDTVVRGSYSFVADDGQLYTVRYYASAATGFVVEGDHIPK